MTRTVYKNKLVKAGFPVQADQDVLHIIAKANGGADHPNNYHFVGNASLNRSLGNRNDHVMAFMAGKRRRPGGSHLQGVMQLQRTRRCSALSRRRSRASRSATSDSGKDSVVRFAVPFAAQAQPVARAATI